jgi:hypothetical protein
MNPALLPHDSAPTILPLPDCPCQTAPAKLALPNWPYQTAPAAPSSATRVGPDLNQAKSISRIYRTPRILDRTIALQAYDGPIREICIADLGHEEPTILLTNQLKRSPRDLIGRYAKRMIIEDSISDGIEFFHMDALSSAVAMKVDCDLQLTLMASSLYRLLGCQIGKGYEHAKSQHIFRDFIDASATVSISEREIVVRFQKRAHNPLLLATGLGSTKVRVPWLGSKSLTLVFG